MVLFSMANNIQMHLFSVTNPSDDKVRYRSSKIQRSKLDLLLLLVVKPMGIAMGIARAIAHFDPTCN